MAETPFQGGSLDHDAAHFARPPSHRPFLEHSFTVDHPPCNCARGSLSTSPNPCCPGRWSATRSTSSRVTKDIRARSKKMTPGSAAAAQGGAWTWHAREGMEGFWSLLRSWQRPHRGISQEKLPLYLGFFQFVHNTRIRGKGLMTPLLALLNSSWTVRNLY